jgi:fibronectin type 3 domain-containing protein
MKATSHRWPQPVSVSVLFLFAVLACAGGCRKSKHPVTISWTPSVSPVVGYNVYRAPASGGVFKKLNSSLVTETQYTDTSVRDGQSYSYYVTAVDSRKLESRASETTAATIPSQ